MDISPYIESLRRDLARAAEVGGEDVRAAAERLAGALDAALRLTLMEILSQAAAEISAELADTAVEVRLNGREPVFAVTAAPGHSHETTASDEKTAAADFSDDESVARITLRLPEPLKVRIEALAARRGQSLNTWLVGAARAAVAGDGPPHGQGYKDRHGLPKRLQGWAR